MEDIKALVVRNDMGLPPDKVSELTGLLTRKSISFLSPEKEGGPFMLYLCGDDLKTIAIKTSLPPDVILLTAIHYKWPEKARLLQKDITEQGIEQLQKEMTKSMLVATYISVQKQLGDVIAGRVDPATCPLIPRNIQGIEKLMAMIAGISNQKDAKSPGTTNVTAQNVQIVQGVAPKQVEETKEKKEEKALMASILEEV